MHREDVGAAEQLVLLDALDPLRGGLLGGQVLAPGDRLHAEGEADPADRAAEPAETQEAQRLAGDAVADAGLPAALAHQRVIFRDAAGRPENEPPSQLGGVLVAASRTPGPAHRDAAVLQRRHVERRIAHAGVKQQLKLRQAIDNPPRKRGALAHRRDDLAVGERAHHVILVGERKALDGDLDAARPHRRPIRHVERDALVIVQNAEPHRKNLLVFVGSSVSGEQRRVIVEDAQDVVAAAIGDFEDRPLDAGLAVALQRRLVGRRAKDRDRQALRVAPGRLGEAGEPRHLFLGVPAARRAREPAVAIVDDAAQRVIGLAAEDDRRMRALHRLGIRPDLVEIDHRPVILGLLLGPQRLHREDALAHQLEAGFVAGAVVFHLLDIPAAADAEDDAAARQLVEAGHRFRGDDRVALGNETDPGAEQQLAGRRRGERQRDERVVGVGVALRQLATAGKRALAAQRDVGVLRYEQRLKPARFERRRQLGDVDAVIDRKIENPDLHVMPPDVARLPPGNRLDRPLLRRHATRLDAGIGPASGSANAKGAARGEASGGGRVCRIKVPEAKAIPFSANTRYMRLTYSRCTQLGLTGRAVNLKRSTTAVSATSAMPCIFSGRITSEAISGSSCMSRPMRFTVLRTSSISLPGARRRLNLIVAKSRLRLLTAPSWPYGIVFSGPLWWRSLIERMPSVSTVPLRRPVSMYSPTRNASSQM